MKIVFLVSSLGPGGAERVATTLCNAWSDRGDSVTLTATFREGADPFYQLSPGIALIQMAEVLAGKPGGFLGYLLKLNAIRTLIKSAKPDVVVSFLPNVNLAAILATLFTGTPVVISERRDPSSQKGKWLLEWGCKCLYRFAEVVVVQTRSVVESLPEIYGGISAIRCIPNPLPDDISGLRLHPAGGRKTLVSLGRLAEEKQVDHILLAFQSVCARFPDWDLHVYGDGPLAPLLAGQIDALGLTGRAHLKGPTTTPWAVMAGATAFVMASRFEGFPNALLEAMGMGLPCLAYDCPSGPRDITDQGRDGLLVPLDDRQGLAEAMGKLMEDESLRKRLGLQARDSVQHRFGLGAVLDRWDALFRGLGVMS